VDSRERVEAALAGRKPDRPPIGAWGHTYREEWSPEALARITVERTRRFAWDYVKFQPRASCFAEAFGNEYRPSNHPFQSGPLVRAAVESVSDWERLRLVNQKALDDQVESIGIVCRELGDRVPVLQTVFSPISVAAYLVGKDKRLVVRQLRRQPEVVLPALERIGDVLVDFSQRSVAAGAAGLFYAISGFASRGSMPQDVYENLLLPLDQRIVDAFPAAAWFNVLHVCGSRIYLDLARRLPVHAVSWASHQAGNPSLAEGQALLEGKAVMGGVAQRTTLLRGPASAIRKEIAEAERETGGKGLILAPGCSVPPRVRAENLEAMASAA
jgi:uroporphyrinogen decarboxylase